MKTIKLLIFPLLLVSGCNFQKQADQQFGDQHFKTAIALIELHKIRYGEYPENLSKLKFVGDWDQLALRSVSYSKLKNGYTLQVSRGWVGKPNLKYPAEFWQGLGIKNTDLYTSANHKK